MRQKVPHRRREQRQERHEATGSGAETEAEDKEGNKEDGDRDRETPMGETVEVLHVGGGLRPPQKKTRTYQTSHLSVCTYSCRKYMETFHTTTMGQTSTGKSWTTLCGSAVGTG